MRKVYLPLWNLVKQATLSAVPLGSREPLCIGLTLKEAVHLALSWHLKKSLNCLGYTEVWGEASPHPATALTVLSLSLRRISAPISLSA